MLICDKKLRQRNWTLFYTLYNHDSVKGIFQHKMNYCKCMCIKGQVFQTSSITGASMARGRSRGHKGGRKQFSNPDQIKDDIAKEEEKRRWREAHPDSR